MAKGSSKIVAGVAGWKMTGSWGKLRYMLAPHKYKPVLDKYIEKATKFNALMVQREIRARIRSGKYDKNAHLTQVIKGSSKPLVNNADMWKSVSHQMVNPLTAWVGVMRTAKSEDGEDLFNLALALHEGETITVTDAMRLLFLILFEATRQGKATDVKLEGRAEQIYEQWKGEEPIYPLKPDTELIVLPPRPFIRDVFDDKKIQAMCKQNWEKAIKEGLDAIAAGAH